MTESTQAPDVAAPMDTQNSSRASGPSKDSAEETSTEKSAESASSANDKRGAGDELDATAADATAAPPVSPVTSSAAGAADTPKTLQEQKENNVQKSTEGDAAEQAADKHEDTEAATQKNKRKEGSVEADTSSEKPAAVDAVAAASSVEANRCEKPPDDEQKDDVAMEVQAPPESSAVAGGTTSATGATAAGATDAADGLPTTTESASTTEANDASSEKSSGKTDADKDKQGGATDNVERMEVDQKDEPTVEQKKRLIRESPCGNDCSNGCNGKFTEDQRVRIYDIYWAIPSGTEEQQKWMEKHCIDKAIPKVSSKSIGSTRNRTFVYLYFLPQPDDNMQKTRVCKKYLAATLGITERILSGFVYRFVGSAGLDIDDGEWSPAAGYEGCSREQIFLLREFIQGLPALPIHYCRNEQCTRKLYELPASIPDVSTLYGMYSSAEESLQREPVEESVFRAVLHQDYNLGFSSNARGDVCSVREYRKGTKK